MYHPRKAILLLTILSVSACKEAKPDSSIVEPGPEIGSLEDYLSRSSVILEVTHYEEEQFIKAKLKKVIYKEGRVELAFKEGYKIPYVQHLIEENVDYGKSSLIFLGGSDLDVVGSITIFDGNILLSVSEVVEMAKRKK